jgi:Protein of unknown function (DUF2937)
MSFLARWLSSAWVLSLAFGAALILMHAPAFTDAYSAALLQVASDARRDVDQRISSARRHYAITAEDEPAVIAALASREPSNAETLTLSVGRAATLRAAYDRIAGASVFLRPLVAAIDAAYDPDGYKRNVLRLAVETFVPSIQLSLAALGWALTGIVLASFLAHVLLVVPRALFRRRRADRRARNSWYVPPREQSLPR